MPGSTASNLSGWKKFIVAALVGSISCGANTLAGASAVVELGDDFYIVPTGKKSSLSAGRYCAVADMVGTHTFGTVSLERPLMIMIYSNGSATITGPDSTVPATVSGNSISSSFYVSASQSGATCAGTLNLSGTGNQASTAIFGGVSGTLPCDILISSLSVSGSFVARKTSASTCPGI